MAAVEIPEVMVTGNLIPIHEFDRVRSPVCLLRPPRNTDPRKSWSASGFYVNVKLKDKSLHFIMTNYHVYEEKEKHNQTMVAVFHHESAEKDTVEIPLLPFAIFASNKELDYVLIRFGESLRESLTDVKPIMADVTKLPIVKTGDTVYIIQHPAGMEKHFSQDIVKCVNPPFIEYYADTLGGSSGSPIFILIKSSFLLVALHSKGVVYPSYSSNWNKGVLLSEIFNHLQTGKVTKPAFSTPYIADQVESGVHIVGTKDPYQVVSREDIRYIAKDITEEWEELGRALGLSDSTLNIINADNAKVYNKCYWMLMKWTRIKVSQANYGALSLGFSDPTVNRCELITKYC